MPTYADRVKETSTTTGTGSVTLAGSVTGFRTFASVFSVSDTMYYVIDGVNADGSSSGQWEVGLGTLSGATTLARTRVIASSNAGSAVNFSAGTKYVYHTIAAESVIASGVTLSATGAITALSIAGGTVTSSTPVLDATQTWNSGGTTFTGWKLNVTDTASASASLLMDLQVGGSSKFNVIKDGSFTNPLNSKWYSIGFASTYIQMQGHVDKISLVSNAGPFLNVDQTGIQLGKGANSTYLSVDAANTLALRNSTNAQTFNWYFSYTDASNYTRGALKTSSGVVEVAAESAGTGTANIDLKLTTKGTGVVQYGTHSAIAGETVTGYITIKDAGGTTRKLAVVS